MIKHPNPFDSISNDFFCWYLYLWWWTEQFLEWIVQISVSFIYNKSILTKIKNWYHVSLTSNISAKTWSNCTCRRCFEIVRTTRTIEQNKIQCTFCNHCIWWTSWEKNVPGWILKLFWNYGWINKYSRVPSLTHKKPFGYSVLVMGDIRLFRVHLEMTWTQSRQCKKILIHNSALWHSSASNDQDYQM